MRKIIFWMMTTLDGYHEGPDHDLSWHMVDEELHSFFNKELAGMSAFLGGRRNWELMDSYWPHADEDPDADEVTREFAGIWRGMPKYVFSTTLQETSDGSTIVREVDPDWVNALKQQPGGDMVVGGAILTSSFFRHGLVDEVRAYVNPIVLGEGSPMFLPGQPRIDLRLVESRPFGNGVIMLRYDVGR